MDIFYHAMNYTSKGIIDAACCGAFKRKRAEEANQLIENLAKNNYKAPCETSGSSSRLRGSGVEQNVSYRGKTRRSDKQSMHAGKKQPISPSSLNSGRSTKSFE